MTRDNGDSMMRCWQALRVAVKKSNTVNVLALSTCAIVDHTLLRLLAFLH